jgi:hypothetical protein
MPIAREEIASYINIWNTHGIRKQSHRINSINGQPNVLYHLSEDGIRNYGSKPDQVVLQTLLDEHNFGKLFSFLSAKLYSIPWN